MNYLGKKQSSIFTVACYNMILLVNSSICQADSVSYAKNWISNPELNKHRKPETMQTNLPWLGHIRDVLVRALQNPDHARDLVALHNAKGTKTQNSYLDYVGPIASGPTATQGPEVRQSVLKSIRLYAQKETKLNVFPAALREGLRFNIGGSSGTQIKHGIQNGDPRMHYGLVLTNIEANHQGIKIASIDEMDYRTVAYAPKAHLVYRIGEVYPEAGAQNYPATFPAPHTLPSQTFWSRLPALPSYKFSGRMTPRGLPSPGNLIPPQTLTLEQNQGFYQVEAQLSSTLKQEAVLHRWRIPAYNALIYRQERNKEWQISKSAFDNIYSNDQGISINLERFHLENRYQLGFIVRKHLHNFELYAHIPNAALESDDFWPQHRWESRFDFRF